MLVHSVVHVVLVCLSSTSISEKAFYRTVLCIYIYIERERARETERERERQEF